MIGCVPMRCLLLLTLSAALPAQGTVGFAAAEQAYREGRFAEAQRAFAALETQAGAAASPELLFDLALAALANGEIELAEASVERAAARGDQAFAARRDFVLGNIAWARGQAAAALATQVEAEPFAFRPALMHIEAARNSWLRATLASMQDQADRAAARRNVERAMLRLLELQQLRDAAEARRRKESGGGDARPKLVPDGDDQGESGNSRPGTDTATEANELQPLTVELSAAELAAMFERLDSKAQEKRAMRRERKIAQRVSVERDW